MRASFLILYLAALLALLAPSATIALTTKAATATAQQELRDAGKLLAPELKKFDYAIFEKEMGARQAKQLHVIMTMEADDDEKEARLKSAAVATPSAARTVTGADLQDIKDTAMFSEIAYCGSATTLATWSCSAKTCGSTAAKGTRLVQYLAGRTNAGYVAYNAARNTVMVAFRGSSNVANWIDNLEFGKITYPFTVPTTFKSKPKVHKGFVDAYNEVRPTLLQAIATAKSRYPTAKITITGHSLGGAIATLAAADLAASGEVAASRVQLTVFNSPRVGTSEFSDLIGSLNLAHVARYVEENDIVSHLPPTFLGFEHVVGEKYQRSGTVYACVGAEDQSCSDARVPFTSVSAHLAFFGKSGFFGGSGC
ncbi:hypothetical protein GGF31_008864 [Allomyces arbusculus]|nr:hypothetical protein GGF31_008864 [Allomyces arbusculus]